jgi:FlaA1/EpsC-like NDP-sugar epimerase
MVFIKDFWQNNFKPDRNIYPTEYITTIIPFYIFTWILCVYYSGGFDKPYKPYRVLRGIAIGTLFISSISNFVDGLRYSKALILIGALWTASVLIFTRYASNWLKFRKLTLYIPTQKRVIIVGNNSESERVAALIRRVHTQADILGFVSTESYKDSREIYLGSLSNINDIMKLYRPDEVIFCSQSISNGEIMEYMAQAAYTEIEFKIVPDNSNFIIGSSSKNTQGELYTLDIHLAILEPQNVRKKRMLDIFVSIFILILSPIAVFLVTNKSHFLNRVLHVLLGNKSFVGFEHTGLTAPTKLKEGILSPITEFQELSLDKDTIQRLNILYAKDYSPQSDLYIIWRNWRKI